MRIWNHLQLHLAKEHRFFGPLDQIEVSGFYERSVSCVHFAVLDKEVVVLLLTVFTRFHLILP